MPFFYDQISGESGLKQFDTYLDNQIYLYQLRKDVKDITNYQLTEVRRAIQKNSIQTQSAIDNSVKNICGSLEIGFSQITNELTKVNECLGNINDGIEDISWRLNELNENIVGLTSLIDWKTDLIIEQQQITNRFLKQIAKGVFLTPQKKANIAHNKQGNLLLKAAMKQGRDSSLYKDAISEFSKAAENDEYDFLSYKQLGFIYYMYRHFDVEKAEYYFSQSAKNALIASEDPAEKNRATAAAASSLFYASCCNYILNKLQAAVDQIIQAVKISPDNQKYKFQLAKYLAITGYENKAANILRDVIKQEKLYSIEILKDQDLITKPAIQDMLNEITKKEVGEVEAEIARIKLIAFDERTRSVINTIEQDFNPKTYITALGTKVKLRIN